MCEFYLSECAPEFWVEFVKPVYVPYGVRACGQNMNVHVTYVSKIPDTDVTHPAHRLAKGASVPSLTPPYTPPSLHSRPLARCAVQAQLTKATVPTANPCLRLAKLSAAAAARATSRVAALLSLLSSCSRHASTTFAARSLISCSHRTRHPRHFQVPTHSPEPGQALAPAQKAVPCHHFRQRPQVFPVIALPAFLQAWHVSEPFFFPPPPDIVDDDDFTAAFVRCTRLTAPASVSSRATVAPTPTLGAVTVDPAAAAAPAAPAAPPATVAPPAAAAVAAAAAPKASA